MQVASVKQGVIIRLAVLALLVWVFSAVSASVEEHPTCGPSVEEGFSNVQIETSDVTLHERFFEEVLHAKTIQRAEHPKMNLIRVYCFRDVAVAIRQDLRRPRETGWVQINFWVKDVAAAYESLQSAVRDSSLAQLSEADRDKIVRFRMKPGVTRGHDKVDRLEVYGPEGFLIGFDQPKP
jgi:hypothetical protein